MDSRFFIMDEAGRIVCLWRDLVEKLDSELAFLMLLDSIDSLNLDSKNQSLHIEVYGAVQGVGFRPLVFGLANGLKLSGFVRNLQGAVEILINPSDSQNIKSFIFSLLLASEASQSRSRFQKALAKTAKTSSLLLAFENLTRPLFLPSLASIKSLCLSLRPLSDQTLLSSFLILESKATKTSSLSLSLPLDKGICASCLHDMQNRPRFQNYPFIACVNCGPRYSLIKSLPYDRANTSMRALPTCASCLDDYENPKDKRFHTEVLSCNECQIPMEFYELQALDSKKLNKISSHQSLEKLAASLIANKLVLYKGLGGLAFLAHARSSAPLRLLRLTKRRAHKPLVIMAPLPSLEKLAILSSEAKSILLSPESPIVIVPKSKNYDLASEVSSLCTIGVMQPYSPALLMLFSYLPKDFVLVYTSANKKGEMISTHIGELDIEALLPLILEGQGSLPIFDYKREILRRVDDSIVLGFDLRGTRHTRPKAAAIIQGLENLQGLRALRISRGLAPLALSFKNLRLHTLSAGFGAMQKSSIAFGLESNCVISPYLGDLFSVKNCAHFREVFSFFENTYGQPEVFIVDKHKGYASTQIATSLAKEYEEKGRVVRLEGVYHHHAHLNALLLESNQKDGLGIIFDGNGLGQDGSLWGGEFLFGNFKAIERKFYFKPFRILGGQTADRELGRLCLSYALHNNLCELADFARYRLGGLESSLLDSMFANVPFGAHNLTSAVGRLFDIAGFLLGLNRLDYEGQSGEILSSLAIDSIGAFDLRGVRFLPYECAFQGEVIDLSPCFVAMLKALNAGENRGLVSLRFIDTLCFCVSEVLENLGVKLGLFGGGVFANVLLCARLKQVLDSKNIDSFFPKLPCNDYSISLGQIAYAATL